MKSKSCGNCYFFQKWKNDNWNSGVCEFEDCRTNTDCGKACPEWKGIKYDKKKRKKFNSWERLYEDYT